MPSEDALAEGQVIGPVEIGAVAHGGHWVARHEGRVIFVRHALAGEVALVRITGVSKRFARGDAVEVLRPSPHRVPAPCPIAGECGGCDFQHVALAEQRELKRQVVAEQLKRLAGLDAPVQVEPVDPVGTGWRTRVRYHGGQEDWGMHPFRSTAVVPLPAQGCLIAAPGLERPPGVPPAAGGQVLGVRSASGVSWSQGPTDEIVRERVHERTFDVRADGFWQVHPAAAATLTQAVIDGVDAQPGESAWDLYCGVGLFSAALAEHGVRVAGVEGDRDAVRLARRNVPSARFWAGDVASRLGALPPRPNLIVLDPPRVGAGDTVMRAVLEQEPRRIAYVACDPAALARDLRTALTAGWAVESLRAFDLFGMTHHVECVAILGHDGRA